jgi:hypothetical protein
LGVPKICRVYQDKKTIANKMDDGLAFTEQPGNIPY